MTALVCDCEDVCECVSIKYFNFYILHIES